MIGKVIITGKAASGKNYLIDEMLKIGYNILPKYTTRPKRIGEVQGKDYIFITNEQYNLLKATNYFATHQEFKIDDNVWQYGISHYDLNNSDVLILTPFEINQLSEELKNNFFIIYLNIDKDIRLYRLTKRNDNNDKALRRVQSDDIVFKDFKDFDLKIKNKNFDSHDIVTILELIYNKK